MTAGTDPVVSVVIPVLNAVRTIAGCLDALSAQRDPPPWELIVVDNGSNDDTRAIVERHPTAARLLQEGTRGPYAARNAGVRAARGAVVAFTDADCEPRPDWLAAGVRAITAGADLVGGAIEQPASPSPSLWERYDRAVYLDQRDFTENQGFAATANLFVKAEVFARIGTFRPELVASGDVEFGRRARDAGYGLAYASEAGVLHHPRTSFAETWRLHRKLGSGFAELARAGLRGPAWRDPALRLSLGDVAERTRTGGERVRKRRLAGVHAVAMAARWVGRLTGRG